MNSDTWFWQLHIAFVYVSVYIHWKKDELKLMTASGMKVPEEANYSVPLLASRYNTWKHTHICY